MRRKEKPTMNMEELSRRTGQSARQTRYLISLKLVPNPAGGRQMAAYGETHADAVERYERLRRAGIPSATLRAWAAQGITSEPLDLQLGDRAVLRINPDFLSRLDPAEVGSCVERLLRDAQTSLPPAPPA